MTLAEMVDYAKRRFQGSEVPDDDWIEYLNDAYFQFLAEADFLAEITTSTATVFAQSRSIELPPNTLGVLGVMDRTHKEKLEPLASYRQAYELHPDLLDTVAENSTHYLPMGHGIHVFPRSAGEWEIEVIAYREPDRLQDPTDTPILPQRYHRAVVNGALAHAFLDDQNIERAAGVQEFFNDAVRQARSDITTRSTEVMPAITDDFFGG